ncbi:MAG: isocitrate lyase/PEP mutase family protein [Nocardioidaceae bacterium]
MTDYATKSERFLALHLGDSPLLLPNPWDVGSAKLLAYLGFSALATTSSGYAATLGRLDGAVTKIEALDHARQIVEATPLPVSADLENGFGDDPEAVADTMSEAIAAGLAGASVEDYSGRAESPIYDAGLARERVAAAVESAHGGPVKLVVTARAENYLHGNPDLADTIARLQSFQAAGADVLYAPGISDLDDMHSLVSSVDLPVNALALPGLGSVGHLAAVGVRRISVGGSIAFAALGAVVEASRELIDEGTFGFLAHAGEGSAAARAAFTS